MATLLGEWGFLGNLNDTSGNGRHGTATNYTPVYVAGPQAGTQAIQFTGVGQNVDVGRAGLEPDATSGGVTSMVWFNAPIAFTSGQYSAFQKAKADDGSTRVGLQLQNGTTRLLARWKNDLHYIENVPPAINDAQWHHMAVVDGDTEWAMYIDGILQTNGSGNRNFDTTTSPSWEDHPWVFGYALNLGDSLDGARISGGRIFAGQMTQSEIQTWMNTPATGSPAQLFTGAYIGSSPAIAINIGSQQIWP